MGYYHTWRLAVAHVDIDVTAEFEVWLETQSKIEPKRKAYLYKRLLDSKIERFTPDNADKLVYGNDWKYPQEWDQIMKDIKEHCDKVGLAWSYANVGEDFEDAAIEHGDQGYSLLEITRTIEDVPH